MSLSSPTEQRRSPLSVLRHRDFALYWSGQAVSLTGTWMQVLALNWTVVLLAGSALALGTLNFVGALPMMLLTLIGGHVADRFDKRRILLITQFFFMTTALTLAALAGTGRLRLWHIYALAVVNGICNAYDMPANQALTPELVEREEIPQAIALNQSIFHGSRIIGPGVAGVLIGAWGIVAAFIANGLSFLAVIASLLMIRSRPPSEHRPHGSPLESMKEGLRYVRERPRLLVLMGLSMLTASVVFPNLAVLMTLYAKAVLGVGAKELGMLMGASGLGALTGSLLLLSVREEKRLARIGMGMCGITLALITLSQSRSLYLSLAAVFFNSLSLSSALGLSATIVQEVVPGHLRGRHEPEHPDVRGAHAVHDAGAVGPRRRDRAAERDAAERHLVWLGQPVPLPELRGLARDPRLPGSAPTLPGGRFCRLTDRSVDTRCEESAKAAARRRRLDWIVR